jgi:prepilin-type N-terminal cleavage/methylation domain-containing protein
MHMMRHSLSGRQMRWRRAARPQRAFTLPEVLVTLVFIGVALPATLRGISIAMGMAERARNSAQAAVLADAKLNEIVSQASTMNAGGSGDFAPEFPQYHWVAQMGASPLATAAGLSNLYEIAVEVTWTERGQARAYQTSTLWEEPSSTTSSGGTTGGGLP